MQTYRYEPATDSLVVLRVVKTPPAPHHSCTHLHWFRRDGDHTTTLVAGFCTVHPSVDADDDRDDNDGDDGADPCTYETNLWVAALSSSDNDAPRARPSAS